jgi:cold-inducible RNA-binding protein
VLGHSAKDRTFASERLYANEDFAREIKNRRSCYFPAAYICQKINMKLFVAGLPFDVDDWELQEMFEAYGIVASAKVITDRETGKSRGFGFVEFPADAEAEAAIKALNGGSLEGRELTVKLAEDKPRNAGGSGFRGGNNSRGGGSGSNRDRNRY